MDEASREWSVGNAIYSVDKMMPLPVSTQVNTPKRADEAMFDRVKEPVRINQLQIVVYYMKRVFISFRAEDRPQVNGLRLLAANPKFEIEFYDESVRTPYDSNDPTYIRRKIREKINRTSVTVCLVSELTYASQWVNWELKKTSIRAARSYAWGCPTDLKH